ncbi:MAG: hypothetical protein HY454_01350 [Parcubacteria group bacterium]|nr:hypothetical protein [Parcubacteria group bacterium]
MEKEELRSWGVSLTEDIPKSMDYECLDCGWGCWITDAWKNGWAIGFDSDLSRGRVSTKDYVVGQLIIECPKCFSKFWFHITERNVQNMKRLGLWPGLDLRDRD